MAGKWVDIFGTVKTFFRLGIGGPGLKNDSGECQARNTDDSAFANLQVNRLRAADNSIEINSDAAGSGNDFTLLLTRGTGQTGALEFEFPDTAGTSGQVLAKGSGNKVGWTNITTDLSQTQNWDATSLAFGSVSPVTMFELPSAAIVYAVAVVIDTPFDGTPSMSVGIAGNTSKYLSSTQVDLTAAATTMFEVYPGLNAAGITEDLIMTFSAGGATQGAARVGVAFVTPG